jgi:caffeoyl-CoA O-methyltransferase
LIWRPIRDLGQSKTLISAAGFQQMMTTINEYTENYTKTESELLRMLRGEAERSFSDVQMLSGFFQGRFLSQISRMLQPRRVLEIGTYLGYSALCLAEGLAEEGRIITLDINEATARFARSFWDQSEYRDRIEQRLGNALEIIPGIEDSFDLVFIDADKPNYANYYRLVFDKVRAGGYILADNVLWSGKVLQAAAGDEAVDKNTQALHEFNEMIQADGRVSNILLPIRDGLMLIRKER